MASTTECSVRSNGEYDRIWSTTECGVRRNARYDRMWSTIEWGVRPNARYDRKACTIEWHKGTIEWHTAHERMTCSTIQWDGGYDPTAFLTRMPLHIKALSPCVRISDEINDATNTIGETTILEIKETIRPEIIV